MEKTDMPKIKNCPDCNEKADLVICWSSRKFKISCSVCEHEQKQWFYGAVLAAKEWNKQHTKIKV